MRGGCAASVCLPRVFGENLQAFKVNPIFSFFTLDTSLRVLFYHLASIMYKPNTNIHLQFFGCNTAPLHQCDLSEYGGRVTSVVRLRVAVGIRD